jgi:hypothetical protein
MFEFVFFNKLKWCVCVFVISASDKFKWWEGGVKRLLEERLCALEVLSRCRNLVFFVAAVGVFGKVAPDLVHEGRLGTLGR